MSAWINHVKKYYNDKKKSNPSYKYKNAMSDAKSTYKSNGGGTQTKKTRKHRKSRRKR
jgi:hypothetical protein